MLYEHSFDEGPFDLVIRVTGTLTLEGMLAGRKQVLADGRLRTGMSALYDYTRANGGNLTAGDIRAMASSSSAIDQFSFRALAMAASEDLEFGFLRMFAVLADAESVAEHYTVVRSVAEAEQWLLGLPDG